MTSSDVAICEPPLKLKQMLKRHSSYEDLPKEFSDEKLCNAPCSVPPENSGKICVCAPTKHAGSFRCRFHRPVHRPHKQSPSKYCSVKTNNVKTSRLSKMVKDTQLGKDTNESSSPFMAD